MGMTATSFPRRSLLLATAASLLNPAARAAQAQAEDWTDVARNRTLPMLLRWPDGQAPCPLVVYSHGLGGDRGGGDVWGQAWQQAGIAVLHVQHPGSDDSLWRGKPGGGLAALRVGATAQQLIARVADVKFVVNEVIRRQQTAQLNSANPWARVQLNALGMAGHSFGATTSQALAGERYAVPSDLAEPRFKAFAAFSPSLRQSAVGQRTAQQKFGHITRPFLSLTGSLDGDPFGSFQTGEPREQVYGGLPPGNKALLVLEGADHMTFGGNAQTIRSTRALPREPQTIEREIAHHALVARLTTQWWRTHLMGDGAVEQPRGLASADRWVTK